MIWTVIRIALFLSLIGALSYGASLLLDTSGGLQITAAGYEITLGPLQSVIVLVALLCAVWLILKLASLLMAVLRFVNGDETALTRFFSRNRERRGFKALTEGVWALASGDGDVAMRKLAKAEKYLAKPELTNVLIAQAAETSGQHDKAHGIYKELVTQDQTRFIGVRGLLKQKLTAGDTQTSLKLAERAYALKPANREVQDILFDLQTEVKDWSGARKTLGGKLKSGALPRDVFRRRDAILALSQARDVLAEDATIDMQEAAIEANRLSPDLAPAAALVADGYIEKKNKRYADRVIKKAWRLAPHPDLAAAYARIDPDEEADTRLKRFEKLAKTNPDHRETKLMMAELHVASEDFPQARRALGD
ncbi:MAG: heme biosynthesis HemY N-terminal domain-containing protein, partial [Paracoccaceae bacterium]